MDLTKFLLLHLFLKNRLEKNIQNIQLLKVFCLQSINFMMILIIIICLLCENTKITISNF